MNMIKIPIQPILLVVLILSGCAHTTKLSEEDRLLVHSVAIPVESQDIQFPPKPFYISRYDAPFIGLGGLDILVSEIIKGINEDDVDEIDFSELGESPTTEEIITFVFDKWGFNITGSLQEIFEKEFLADGIFPADPNSDYVFTLKVDSYGYQVPAKLSLADTVLSLIHISEPTRPY